jgi:hypothetical protein
MQALMSMHALLQGFALREGAGDGGFPGFGRVIAQGFAGHAMIEVERLFASSLPRPGPSHVQQEYRGVR